MDSKEKKVCNDIQHLSINAILGNGMFNRVTGK